jgi:uracil-DNA glycosylase family 4
MELDSIYKDIKNCKACFLHQGRTTVVPGHGNILAPLLIIGEGPGLEEDRQGIPFCGRSGNLLGAALMNAGCYPPAERAGRSDVFITNIVKCRPPENRNPTQLEIDTCGPFLERQISSIDPRLILTLGKVASEAILQRPVKITKEHGNLDFREDGRAVMVCYHPAYVLRNQKTETVQKFYETIQDARNIAYGAPNIGLHERGVGGAHTPFS